MSVSDRPAGRGHTIAAAMQLRRLLVFMLLVLFVSGLAAQIAGPPPRGGTETEATTTDQTPTPSLRPAEPPPVAGRAREIELRLGGGDRTAEEHVEVGEHVVVKVAAPEPGQVEIEGLGRTAAADPDTPAIFDLLPDRVGRYEVSFTAPGGRARTVAVIFVEAEAPTRSERRRASPRAAPARRSTR